jgi:tRNA nucleotidyltransferase (CCA-adding enzyme)
MKIITSHERADMDALASIYAACLLYPDHQGVLPQKLNRNLRDFIALYKDELPFIERRRLAQRRVTHVILVDTQAIAPFRGMDAHTETHVIDHHSLEIALGEGLTYEGDPVGATTTLLVEKLRQRSASLTPLGASLLLMGVYEDTGSLCYPTTTARDAEATAWLLAEGADLKLASEYLHRPLSNEQREVLAHLFNASVIHNIRGRSVCIASLALDQYVDELSSLIHQIMDVYEPDACFLLTQHGSGVQVIARSTTDAIDVAALLRALGGGGHSKAAAAHCDEARLETVRADLVRALERHVSPPVLVREIMSTNVHTLRLDMSIRDAAQLMRRYGHEGFPVVEGEQLVGILTRSDVDRALHHRRGDTPVRSILYTGPLHVDPDAPVDDVQRVMLEHGLGQVPVVSEGRFVGLVTRTDLIKLWSAPLYPSRGQELRRLMEDALPPGLRELLITARDVANDLGDSLYIVGGFVRDLLLGAPTLDLDLVVEGDAIRLAEQLARRLGARVRSHARFGTAKLILDGNRAEGVPASLDFVTARTEFYERPSVLPEVERSSIKQDLYRRDFTINTLAICLDRLRYGEILDFYGGERDMREKRIQVLHNLSFVEDPTRILRAVRFEQRLGFAIEARTEELIGDALDLLDDVTGERLRHELYLILAEAEPERALERLSRLGVLAHLYPSLRFTRDLAQLFVRLRERFSSRPNHRDETAEVAPADMRQETTPALALCYLALLASPMAPQEMDGFVTRLRCSSQDARLLHEVGRLREMLGHLQATVMLPSTIDALLSPFSREARFVITVLTASALVRERLDLYERALATVSPRIDGHFIRSLGAPPGPIYGEILARVRSAVLDGQVTTLEQEQALARSLVAAAHPDVGAASHVNGPKRRA